MLLLFDDSRISATHGKAPKMMSNTNSVVAVFDSHDQAERAIRQLQQDGFDMKKLSIVGKDYHTEEHVVGYYTTGDRMLYWGKLGAFWGGFWGLLLGSAFFWVKLSRCFATRSRNGSAPSRRRWAEWTRWCSLVALERMRPRSAAGFPMGWGFLESNSKKRETRPLKA
jgi:hypothetical protein